MDVPLADVAELPEIANHVREFLCMLTREVDRVLASLMDASGEPVSAH